MLISENVERVRERIARACERAGRASSDVTLIAVTKTQSAERVLEAVKSGVQDFGENYIQEAREKIPSVLEQTQVFNLPPVTFHCIGHLQSNKAKYSVSLFSLIHSVDNFGLLQEIAKQSAKLDKEQSVLLEVNLTGSEIRAGVSPDNVFTLVEQAVRTPNVRLCGLMGMAPYGDNPEDARTYFRTLKSLYDRLPTEDRRVLSMGMSGDFEVAIEEGATHVRIGTALFGTRQP